MATQVGSPRNLHPPLDKPTAVHLRHEEHTVISEPHHASAGPLEQSPSSTLKQIAIIALVIFCWLICTVAQVEKYLSPKKATLVIGLGCGCVVAVMLVLRRLYLQRRDAGRWTFVCALALLMLSFAVIYPKSLRHEVGKGSDREDALRVELVAVMHHQYPYDARTFLNHLPTPLPGAIWLATPFFLTGRIAFQNLFWAAVFVLVLQRFFRANATTFAFVLLFLITALENLNDFDVGGDYITNILYVVTALFLMTRAIDRKEVSWLTVFAVILFGITLSSRVIYMVTLLPLFAYALQRIILRRTIILFGGVLLVALIATLPVFFPHPITRFLSQLGQNTDKFAQLPRFIPNYVLPIFALALASIGFLVRMSLPRIYLLSGLATLIMIFPPMAFIVRAQGGFAKPLTPDLEYLAVSALFIALWAFHQWEKALPNHSETVS
jgi:hypothetical protein